MSNINWLKETTENQPTLHWDMDFANEMMFWSCKRLITESLREKKKKSGKTVFINDFENRLMVQQKYWKI